MIEAIILLAALVAVHVVFGNIRRLSERTAARSEVSKWPPVEEKKVG
jgi:hypothetical protein